VCIFTQLALPWPPAAAGISKGKWHCCDPYFLHIQVFKPTRVCNVYLRIWFYDVYWKHYNTYC